MKAFKTRNYKIEIDFNSDEFYNSSESYWNNVFKRIKQKKFTGVVFYAGYDPFYHLLDFSAFPEAFEGDKVKQKRRKDKLNLILNIAKKNSLNTLIQKYLSHFSVEIGKHIGINLEKGGSARLAGKNHPMVLEYCRFCYREMLKQFPNLNGFVINFESYSSCKFVLDALVHECNKSKTPPILFFRLWSMFDVEGMKKIVDEYHGKCIFGHKIASFGDTFNLPYADSHFYEWKNHILNVEYAHIAGHCHNCSTNIYGIIWADYDFVQELLADSLRKGADSLTFNTCEDLLHDDIVNEKEEITLGHYNALHLEAASDFFAGKCKSINERISFYAKTLKIDNCAAKYLYNAIKNLSKSETLAYQQFHITSNFESQIIPHRDSLIQDPFFYMPCSEHSFATKRPSRHWLPKVKDFPTAQKNELQYILDYVDPEKQNASRNPRKLAAEIKKTCDAADFWTKKYINEVGAERGEALLDVINTNNAVGMWVYHQIHAAIYCYSAYFKKQRPSIISCLKKGLDELKCVAKIEQDKAILKRIKRGFFFFNFPDITRLISTLSNTIKILEREKSLPSEIYIDFLRSRIEYNEIRRFFRGGYAHRVCDQEKAVKQLKKSKKFAEKSYSKLVEKRKNSKYLKAVNSWITFLNDEINTFSRKQMNCLYEKIPDTFTSLVHEQCFRAGEHFFSDFSDFIKINTYHRNDDELSFKLSYDSDALTIVFREENIDIKQRLAIWEKYKDTGEDRGFLRVFLISDIKSQEKNKRYIILIFCLKGIYVFLMVRSITSIQILSIKNHHGRILLEFHGN